MKLLKKISAKDILGNVLDVVKGMEIGTTAEAFAVAGICSAYETGVSTYGSWTRFVGEFQGINYLTGEVCRAPKAHVPEVLESLIMEGIRDRSEVINSKCTKTTQFFGLDSPLEFSFKVSITRLPDNEDNSISYQYVTSPMVDVAPNDSISHLTKLIMPALAAPDAPKAQRDIEEETGVPEQPVSAGKKGKGK